MTFYAFAAHETHFLPGSRHTNAKGDTQRSIHFCKIKKAAPKSLSVQPLLNLFGKYINTCFCYNYFRC